MPTSFKWRRQPDPHNFQRGFEGHHALTERKDVGVVVLAAQAGGLNVPTQRAANAFDAIRHHRFAVARTAEDNATLEFAPRHRFRHWPDEERIINWRFRKGTEVAHFMSTFGE